MTEEKIYKFSAKELYKYGLILTSHGRPYGSAKAINGRMRELNIKPLPCRRGQSHIYELSHSQIREINGNRYPKKYVQ